MITFLSRITKILSALGVSLSIFAFAHSSQAVATCDPTTAEDSSCGLKATVEAKYGEGYCADLYD